VGQVACQLTLGAFQSGSPDDESKALGGVQLVHDLAELAALAFIDDLARNPDAVQAGHQDQVAAWDADVGGEGRSLGSNAFLDHLNQHLVAAAEDFLDRGPDHAASPTRAASPRQIIAPAWPGLDRTAQAHFPLQLLDLLDFLADLLLKFRVDLFLGNAGRLGTQVIDDLVFFLDRHVLGVVDVLQVLDVQIEFVDLAAGEPLLGRPARKRRAVPGLGAEVIEVRRKFFAGGGSGFELGALAFTSATSSSSAPFAFPGVGR